MKVYRQQQQQRVSDHEPMKLAAMLAKLQSHFHKERDLRLRTFSSPSTFSVTSVINDRHKTFRSRCIGYGRSVPDNTVTVMK